MSTIVDKAPVESFEMFPTYPIGSYSEFLNDFPVAVGDYYHGCRTFYGIDNGYDNFDVTGDICFGGLFNNVEYDKDYDYFVVTVGTVVDDYITNKLANEWYDFVFNLYPGVRDKVELHVKNVKEGQKSIKVLSGYTIDLTDVPIEPMFHTMQLIRAAGEFPSTIKKWKHLKDNGVNPIFALWIAHRVLYSVDEYKHLNKNTSVRFGDEGRGGGHVIMPKSIDLEKILNGTVFDKYDFSRRISDRVESRQEILGIMSGNFGPMEFKRYFDDIENTETTRDVFGTRVLVLLLENSIKLGSVVETALKVQKEYGYA